MPTVLFIDSHFSTRALIREHFARKGWTLLAASSVKRALQMMPGRHIDAIITDIHLSGISGLAFAVALKKFGLHSALTIGLTAERTSQAEELAIEAIKPHLYLKKPFTPEDLSTALEKCLPDFQTQSEKQATAKVQKQNFEKPKLEKLFRDMQKAQELFKKGDTRAISRFANEVEEEIQSPETQGNPSSEKKDRIVSTQNPTSAFQAQGVLFKDSQGFLASEEKASKILDKTHSYHPRQHNISTQQASAQNFEAKKPQFETRQKKDPQKNIGISPKSQARENTHSDDSFVLSENSFDFRSFSKDSVIHPKDYAPSSKADFHKEKDQSSPSLDSLDDLHTDARPPRKFQLKATIANIREEMRKARNAGGPTIKTSPGFERKYQEKERIVETKNIPPSTDSQKVEHTQSTGFKKRIDPDFNFSSKATIKTSPARSQEKPAGSTIKTTPPPLAPEGLVGSKVTDSGRYRKLTQEQDLLKTQKLPQGSKDSKSHNTTPSQTAIPEKTILFKTSAGLSALSENLSSKIKEHRNPLSSNQETTKVSNSSQAQHSSEDSLHGASQTKDHSSESKISASQNKKDQKNEDKIKSTDQPQNALESDTNKLKKPQQKKHASQEKRDKERKQRQKAKQERERWHREKRQKKRAFKDLQDLLKQAFEAYSFPQISQALIDAVSSNKSQPEQIAEIMVDAPILEDRLIRFLNTSFYNLENPVKNTEEATQAIGAEGIRDLVLAAELFEEFQAEDDPGGIDRKRLWLHSIGTALVAHRLTRLASKARVCPESLFCAGLLHDIGKLLFDDLAHDDYTGILERAHSLNLDLNDAEISFFKTDHPTVARLLMRQWHISKQIYQSVACHHLHIDNYASDAIFDKQAGALLIVANRWVHGFGYTDVAHDRLPQIEWEWLTIAELSEATCRVSTQSFYQDLHHTLEYLNASYLLKNWSTSYLDFQGKKVLFAYGPQIALCSLEEYLRQHTDEEPIRIQREKLVLNLEKYNPSFVILDVRGLLEKEMRQLFDQISTSNSTIERTVVITEQEQPFFDDHNLKPLVWKKQAAGVGDILGLTSTPYATSFTHQKDPEEE